MNARRAYQRACWALILVPATANLLLWSTSGAGNAAKALLLLTSIVGMWALSISDRIR